MATQGRASPSRSIFIGNIPWDATEEQLRQICEEVGPIVSLRMVLDKETKKPKGFAFAEYLDEETAESARRNLHGYEINGRFLRVGEPTGGDKGSDRKAHEASRPPVDLPDPGPPLGAPAAAAAASTMAAALGGPQTVPGVAPSVPGGDPLASSMAAMGQQQLYTVLATMKTMIQQNPAQARQILMAKPELTKSLFFAQISLGMVKPQPAASAPLAPTPVPTPTPPLPQAPPARPPPIAANTPPMPAIAPPQPPGPRPPSGPPPVPAPVATPQWATPTPPLPSGPPFAAQPQGGVVRNPPPPPGPPPLHAQPQPQLYANAPAPLPPYPPQHVRPQPPLPPSAPTPPVGVPPPSQRPLVAPGGGATLAQPGAPTPVFTQQGVGQPPLPQVPYTPAQQNLPIPPNLPANMVPIYTRLLSISEAEVNALPPDAQALARSIRQSARSQLNA